MGNITISTNGVLFTSKRLAEARQKTGLSQKDFAASLGLSLRTYQHYERGEREVSATLIRALYVVFGVNPIWLLIDNGDASQLAAGEAVVAASKGTVRSAINLSQPLAGEIRRALAEYNRAVAAVGADPRDIEPRWIALIQELLIARLLTEAGARRFLETIDEKSSSGSPNDDALYTPLVRPRFEPELLNHVEAASLLVSRGIKMNKYRFARLMKEFPDGIKESDLDRVAVLFGVGSDESVKKISLLKRRKS